MNAWISATLTALGRGRSKTVFLRVLFSGVLQSLAIYTVYRALRRSQAKRRPTIEGVSTPDTDTEQWNGQNREKNPGGMLQRSSPSFGEANAALIYTERQKSGPLELLITRK